MDVKGTFRIARVFGIPIEINYTWFFVFLLVLWSMSRHTFPAAYPFLSAGSYWGMGLVTTLFLFGSLLLHELSHSYVAKIHNIPIRSITLFLFGGVSQMTREPEDAQSEFLMAAAGPAMSFLLAFFFYALGLLLTGWNAPTAVLAVVSQLRELNLVIGIFNLIPGFPLDGGRLLRSTLWRLTGNLRFSTKIASNFGKGAAYSLIFLGLISFLVWGNWFNGLWLTLIALFLHEAAENSYKQVLLFSALEESPLTALDLVKPFHPEQVVPPGISLQHALRIMAHYEFEELFVMEGERLVGVLRRPEIIEKIERRK